MKKDNNYTIPLIIGIVGLALLNKREVKENVKSLLYPLLNKITSSFGHRIHPVTGKKSFHNGIDIAGKIGEKIYSPGPGKVQNIYKNDVGGNQLIIKHSNGFVSGYAHLNKILVKLGEPVDNQTIIAEVGRTGRVTGPHLHFTLKDSKGEFVDPLKFLQKNITKTS